MKRTIGPMKGDLEKAQLSRMAVAFRAAHAAFAALQLTALGYVWSCALTGRRDRALAASVGFLLVEGGALIVGRGNCPMGPFQRRLGDPVPLFELVLPPRAAKAAVPVLAAIAVAGMAALAVRSSAGQPVERMPCDVRPAPSIRSALFESRQGWQTATRKAG
jgi:hypothetical protein